MGAGKRGRPSSTPAAGFSPNGAAGPGPGSTSSGVVALHRSRMFEWKPSAVVAIAPCPCAPLFAVGYECGSLELWDMLQLVCIQTVIGPAVELTSLAWARDSVSNAWRTFAAFLDGTIAEVLWHQAAVAHSMDSYGGVVWALAASPVSAVKPGFSHVVAAACDDGSVRLFGCEGGEPGLIPERVLTRLEGRLLTVAWHAGGTMLAVAGSAGNIHLLDAVTGREHRRITAASATSRTVTVWRVLSLPDGTVVSGDSDGAVQMWDGQFGTLLQRFTQHRADVLALAATEDGANVFAAGVDSQVAMFTRVCGGEGAGTHSVESWVYTHYKRPHTHDVRALALLAVPDGSSGSGRGAVLVSGAVDAQLMAYPAKTFLQEHPHRLCKCPQRPLCQVAIASVPPPRLMVAQQDTLDVWQLAGTADPVAAAPALRSGAAGCAAGPPEGEPLELVAAPRHLARIRIRGGRIASASLSPSGRIVACTTPYGTRAYCLQSHEVNGAAAGRTLPPALERLKLPAEAEAPAIAVVATDKHLVLALRNGGLLSCNLSDDTVTVHRKAAKEPVAPSVAPYSQANAQQAWRSYCPTAAQLVAAADGSLLAAVGGQGITLYRLPDLDSLDRTLHADCAFTAAAFSHDSRLFAATTSACQLLVWEMSGVTAGGSDCIQTRWCLDNADAITAAISRLPGTPNSVSFCPATFPRCGVAQPKAVLPYRLVVNSPGGMVHFDLSCNVANTYLDLRTTGNGGTVERRKRGRLRPDQLPQPEDRPESRGSNGRVIRTVHPAVWVGHVGPADLLLLEKPWEEVLGALPPPLLTQRYGHG
ncbi:hypothetical protein VaNZ11_007785 [Volvox africanus]|uniref:Anaphase-promoting complex subunit 4 WD40 domain-containing protein n=1 Tax=Volvox africanus TaxID=51714 RepID=A0ABQ5S3T3_9CHLO|nr:hypothetical protein VaNZ11_007785 [Volvox africanus]